MDLIVPGNGVLVEMGTHQELMQRDAFYVRLHSMQFELQGIVKNDGSF